MTMTKEIQAVMILKAEKDTFWYKRYVGGVVLVTEPIVESMREDQFQIFDNFTKLIKKSDCEVLGKVVEFDND